VFGTLLGVPQIKKKVMRLQAQANFRMEKPYSCLAIIIIRLRYRFMVIPITPTIVTSPRALSDWPGIKLEELPILPLGDVPRLYNVLRSCDVGIQLRLRPDPETQAIVVSGLSTRIPIEGLTMRVLAEALMNLHLNTDAVWNWISQNEGEDLWTMDNY
jgi:hypothetical protein